MPWQLAIAMSQVWETGNAKTTHLTGVLVVSIFVCVFDESSLKSNVYQTISLISNIRIYVQQWICQNIWIEGQYFQANIYFLC